MTQPIVIHVAESNTGTLSFDSEEDYQAWLEEPDFDGVVWTHSESGFSKPLSGDFSDVDYIAVSQELHYEPEHYIKSCEEDGIEPSITGFYDFIADDVMTDFGTSIGSLKHHVVHKTRT